MYFRVFQTFRLLHDTCSCICSPQYLHVGYFSRYCKFLFGYRFNATQDRIFFQSLCRFFFSILIFKNKFPFHTNLLVLSFFFWLRVFEIRKLRSKLMNHIGRVLSKSGESGLCRNEDKQEKKKKTNIVTYRLLI